VLRRLVDDPDALKLAARTALRILHFDPDTGEEHDDQFPGQDDRCVKACYDCLLAYGNQSVHERINRHLVKDLLLRLSKAELHTERIEPAPPPQTDSDAQEDEFTDWLRARGYRLPDGYGEEVFGVCPDLTYHLGNDGGAAVFFDDVDRAAHEVIRDEGWGVIRIGPEDNWESVVRRYPSVFGGMEEGNL
jgi:hypothetical protein